MESINSKNYVDKAEAVIKQLIDEAQQEVQKKHKNSNQYKIITTSQIRNQLAMTADLYSRSVVSADDCLSADIRDQIEYLRVRFAYQAGREPLVKIFINKAGILNILKSINGNKADFLIFCRYMEALVAFRKFYGNKDE